MEFSSDRLRFLFHSLSQPDGHDIEAVSEELLRATNDVRTIPLFLEILLSDDQNYKLQSSIFLNKALKNTKDQISEEKNDEIATFILQNFGRFDRRTSNLLLQPLNALIKTQYSQQLLTDSILSYFSQNDLFHSIILTTMISFSASQNIELVYNMIKSSLESEDQELYNYSLMLAYYTISEIYDNASYENYTNLMTRTLTDFFLRNIQNFNPETLSSIDKILHLCSNKSIPFLITSEILEPIISMISNPKNQITLYHFLQIFSSVIENDENLTFSNDDILMIGKCIIESTPYLYVNSDSIEDQLFDAAEIALSSLLNFLRLQDSREFIWMCLNDILSESTEINLIISIMIINASIEYNENFFSNSYQELFEIIHNLLHVDANLIVNYTISFLSSLFTERSLDIPLDEFDIISDLFQTENIQALFIIPNIINFRGPSDDLFGILTEYIFPLLDSEDINITTASYNIFSAILQNMTIDLKDDVYDNILLSLIGKLNEIDILSAPILSCVKALLMMKSEKIEQIKEQIIVLVIKFISSDDSQCYAEGALFLNQLCKTVYGTEIIFHTWETIFPIVMNYINIDNISKAMFSQQISENHFSSIILPSFFVLGNILERVDALYENGEVISRILQICNNEMNSCLYTNLVEAASFLALQILIKTRENADPQMIADVSKSLCYVLVYANESESVLSTFSLYLAEFDQEFIAAQKLQIIFSIFDSIYEKRNTHTGEWVINQSIVYMQLRILMTLINEEIVKQIWEKYRESLLAFSEDEQFLFFSSNIFTIMLLSNVIHENYFAIISQLCLNNIENSFHFLCKSLKQQNFAQIWLNNLISNFDGIQENAKELAVILIGLAFSKYNYPIPNELITKILDNFVLNNYSISKKFMSFMSHMINDQAKMEIYGTQVCFSVAHFFANSREYVDMIKSSPEKAKTLIGFLLYSLKNEIVTKEQLFGDNDSNFKLMLMNISTRFDDL